MLGCVLVNKPRDQSTTSGQFVYIDLISLYCLFITSDSKYKIHMVHDYCSSVNVLHQKHRPCLKIFIMFKKMFVQNILADNTKRALMHLPHMTKIATKALRITTQ